MDALIAEEPLLILEGTALVAVSLGLILTSIARRRAHQVSNLMARIFWADVSRAGYVWAISTMLVLVGSLGEVEGLGVPMWLLLSTVIGVACLSIVRLRWVRLKLPEVQTTAEDQSDQGRTRILSTSWEIALLYSGGGALLVYGLSVAHDWGQPVPWLFAGIGAAFGYAIGLIVATPRFTVKSSAQG